MQPPLVRRCFVEFLGTFFLVFTIGFTISRGINFLIPTAIVVAIILTFYVPISGAHINPAFTLAYALSKQFPLKEVVPYYLSQILGANFAVLCLEQSLRGGIAAKLCTVLKTAHHQILIEPLLLEFLASFLFMIMILNILALTTSPFKQGVWIGLALIAICTLFGETADLILNPAKSLGTAFFQYRGSPTMNPDGTITTIPYLRDGCITAVTSLLAGGLAGIVHSITHKEESL